MQRARIGGGERFAGIARGRVVGAVSSRNTGALARSASAGGGDGGGARLAPERRRGPAIVDHDQRASAASGSAALRRQARARERQDQQRRRQRAEQHQPQRRALAACSSVRKPSSRRAGGNAARCGGGGVARISHHSSGSASKREQRARARQTESGPKVTRALATPARSAAPAPAPADDRCGARWSAKPSARAEFAHGAPVRCEALGISVARGFGAADAALRSWRPGVWNSVRPRNGKSSSAGSAIITSAPVAPALGRGVQALRARFRPGRRNRS